MNFNKSSRFWMLKKGFNCNLEIEYWALQNRETAGISRLKQKNVTGINVLTDS